MNVKRFAPSFMFYEQTSNRKYYDVLVLIAQYIIASNSRPKRACFGLRISCKYGL